MVNYMKKKQKRLGLWLVCSVLTILLILAAVFFFWIWPVKPVADAIYVELGGTLPSELTDYVSGTEFALEHSRLDLSCVQTEQIGQYTAYVHHGSGMIRVKVIVQDTIAPVIIPKFENYVAVDEEINLADFFDEIYDQSGEVILSIEGRNTDTFSLSQKGETILSVIGTDASGNETKADVLVVVDTPPQISGMKECFLVAGETFDFTKGITAMDDVDGDLTDSLLFDCGRVDYKNPGHYQVEVCSTDRYGLTTVETIDVTVDNADVIQDLINTGQINRFEHHIVGAYNLYDGGYLEPASLDDVVNHFEPAIVAVTRETPTAESRGSGYIVKVTEDLVYVMTNHHVVYQEAGNHSYYVEFYDGSRVPGEVLARSKGRVGRDDMAIVTFHRRDLNQEMEKNLMTIHINLEYWEHLTKQDEVPVAIRVCADSHDFLQSNVVKGNLVETIANDPGLEDNGPATEVNLKIYGGTSGSAILDEHGNLIAMVSCSTSTNNVSRSWGVPLVNIVNFFEASTGLSIHYQ